MLGMLACSINGLALVPDEALGCACHDVMVPNRT